MRVKCFILTGIISKAEFLVVSDFRHQGFSGCEKATVNSKKVIMGSVSLGEILFSLPLLLASSVNVIPS